MGQHPQESTPFNRIEVVDYRYDTSKIGFLSKRKDEKIVLRGGTEKTLTAYLNSYFKDNLDSAATRTLLIVVKKLWLQDESTSRLLQFKNALPLSSPSAHSEPTTTTSLADIDVFAGSSDSYQALLRLSHKFKTEDFSGEDILTYLLRPFDSVVYKTHSIDVENLLAAKNKFTLKEITAGYQKRFDLPILNQPISKGIYLTFEDFRNNRALDDRIENFTEYWGFFDGENLYIKFGRSSYRALRQGNTFDFYGSFKETDFNYFKSKEANEISRLMTLGAAHTVPPQLFQVDMETGKFQ